MAVNRERKIVPHEQQYVDFDNCTLRDVLDQVTKLIKDYGENSIIDSRTDNYSNSDRETMYVYTMGPETDEQYKTRIEYEERWAKEAEERDAAEFKRLQAKFGATK